MNDKPGQLHINELERAVLKRIADDCPALHSIIDSLHVLSRSYTGVGSYTVFNPGDAVDDLPEHHIGLDGVIQLPQVPNGLGAVLFCENDFPKDLELYAFGGDLWDGTFEGFSIKKAP